MPVVAMPPQQESLEDEEREDAGEQRAERGRRRQFLERLRQQREQRSAEQCADRVTDGGWNEFDAEPVAEEEKARSREQTTQAADDAQPDGRRVRLHARMISRVTESR